MSFDIPNTKQNSKMARNTDDHANPEQIRNDVDCRAARPKFENGVWTATKISDATGGGLYLLITLDPNRPGKAGSKLWRMAYRFRSRQKTYSIGLYGNGNDGTVSLATARQKRDAAKALLAQDPPVDPSIEKQFERHRRGGSGGSEQSVLTGFARPGSALQGGDSIIDGGQHGFARTKRIHGARLDEAFKHALVQEARLDAFAEIVQRFEFPLT